MHVAKDCFIDFFPVRLIQQFGLEVVLVFGCCCAKPELTILVVNLSQTDVAKHLMDTYGDRAWAVCSMAEPTGLRWPVHGTRLDASYPYIDAEVKWACRREFAMTAEDIIARRTRLSFLNAEAALDVLPKVIDMMASELNWTETDKENQFKSALAFLESMGISHARVNSLTFDDVRNGRHKLQLSLEDDLISRTVFTVEELADLKQKFTELDQDGDGGISDQDLQVSMSRLGFGDVPKVCPVFHDCFVQA